MKVEVATLAIDGQCGLSDMELYWLTIICIVASPKNMWGLVKKKWNFFPPVIFFLLSFSQALASHLDQRIHTSEEKEKKRQRRGKGKKTVSLSHTDHSWCQKLSLWYRSWTLCMFLYFLVAIIKQTSTRHLPCSKSDTHSMARHYNNRQWNWSDQKH